MYDIIQMKLTTGEEICCEVLDWDEEQLLTHITIRNAMICRSFLTQNDYDETPLEQYHMSPWMVFIERPDQVITVEKKSIVSRAKPHKMFAEEYRNAVNLMYNNCLAREKDWDEYMKTAKENTDIDKVISSLGDKNIIGFPNRKD